VRVVALLIVSLFALAGCSSLLGVTDPRADSPSDARPDGSGSGDDAKGPLDAPIDSSGVADHITVTAPPKIELLPQQQARFHAKLFFTDGSSQDVTASATWTSNDPTIASAAPGVVEGGTVDGTTTITVAAAGVQTTFDAENFAFLTCHPMINEIQAGGNVSASDEWVELFNPCSVAVDVTGWTLDYRAATATGTTDTNLMITLSGSMAPGDVKLFAGNGFPGAADGTWGTGFMQANNGAVGLRSGPKDTGTLVDSVAYGTVSASHPFVEGSATTALSNGKSVARGPFDGNDTDVGGADFVLVATPTPRALNTP
jgi:lamin tail-like protein